MVCGTKSSPLRKNPSEAKGPQSTDCGFFVVNYLSIYLPGELTGCLSVPTERDPLSRDSGSKGEVVRIVRPIYYLTTN